MSNANDASSLYPVFFKKWQTAGMLKLLGPKPTSDQLAKVHALGPRPGKQAFIIAMALRDCGVTPAQMVLITGTKHLNQMGDLTTDAYLREVLMPQVDSMKCYKREITPKGMQRIERTIKAEAATVAAGEAEAVKVPKVKAAASPNKAARKAAKKAKAIAATVAADKAKKAAEASLPNPFTDAPMLNPAVNTDGGALGPSNDAVRDLVEHAETEHVTDLPENQL